MENLEVRRNNFIRVDKTGEIDYILLGVIIIFYLLGIVMVFSASISEGIKLNDPFYFFKRQIIWTALSFLTCILFIFIDYSLLERFVKPLVWGAIILLILVLFPPLIKLGVVHPSRRWFRLYSLGFQPSEFAKIVLIIYLSSILSKKGEKIKDFYKGFLPPFLVISIISFLVFLQPDFSTAFILFFIAILIFFIAGIRTTSIISLVMVSIPALFLMLSKEGYRKERIVGFLNPWASPTDKGYQIIQSFKAFARGGLIGVGLGRGVQKLKYLPIPHSDFIFAVYAEELGFIGVFFVIILYMMFAFRGFRIAYSQEEDFDFLLTFGITSLIVWEAIINITVVIGLMPSTGISLPFLSYGGSSLMSNSILAGILLNVSRKRKNFQNKGEEMLLTNQNFGPGNYD